MLGTAVTIEEIHLGNPRLKADPRGLKEEAI